MGLPGTAQGLNPSRLYQMGKRLKLSQLWRQDLCRSRGNARFWWFTMFVQVLLGSTLKKRALLGPNLWEQEGSTSAFVRAKVDQRPLLNEAQPRRFNHVMANLQNW